MNNSFFLLMVFVGIILFYCGNEVLFNNISGSDWLGQHLFFMMGFAGLCSIVLGLLMAYQLAMNTLYLTFPEYLVRMYRGLHCESSDKYLHKPS